MQKIIPIVIGSYYNAYGLVRGFGEKGIKSILVTYGEKNFVQTSKYIMMLRIVRDVNYDEQGFIEDLIRLGKDIKPKRGMFFPTHDEQLIAIVKHKDLLKEFYEIPCADYEILKRIMNKAIFSKECKNLGIPTIREYKVKNLDDAQRALHDFGLPILVKINQWDINVIECFGDKIALYENDIEYLDSMNRFFGLCPDGELLVQEYIQDSEHSILSINSFTNHDGIMQCIFVLEKRRQYPPFGGTSTATFSMNPEDSKYKDVIAYSKIICKAFKYYGLLGIEYKYDLRDSVYKIIEMNCRSEFFNYLHTLVGQNMSYELYKYHLGKEVTIPYYPVIKSASCYLPVLDKFYVTKLNHYKYPQYTMTEKEWQDSIVAPTTLYGLTIKDFTPFISAYFEAWKNSIISLFRLKNDIPENIHTIDYIKAKLWRADKNF